MKIDTPVSALTRVGKAAASKLRRLNIVTVKDLLYHFPFRYEDYSKISPIHELKEGEMVTVKGRIELVANRRTRFRRIITEALVSDESGSLRIVWFNQPFLTKNLLPGKTVFFSGTVKRDMLGPQLVSPAYELESARNIHTARLVPMYPLTVGLTQKQLRFLVKESLPAAKEVPEWLPEPILKINNFPPLAATLADIHFPENNEALKKAEGRLKFEELFLVQLQAELARLETAAVKAPVLTFHEEEIKKFVASLPFALTRSQKISAWEILQNIGQPTPMNRLLSGDVGSGKTVVGALALYNVVLNQHQGILMAPTEILAAQHFQSVSKLLPKLVIALFSRSQKIVFRNGVTEELSKSQLIKLIANGEINIIIGTHALLSEGVEFKKVGLVIVDEQHRFGVLQRKVIKEKGRGVHFLSMTATPIPRSLALMLYGDLDISIISELPPGRKPVLTRLVEPRHRDKAYEFIRGQVKHGRQVFVVCPLIENESKTSSPSQGESGVGVSFGAAEKKAVLSEYKKLSEQIFPELRVTFLHGRMSGEEKNQIMADFSAQGGSASGGKNKKFDILVSTSVIEVGVDVPNASVMMIEGAERFGLAQLHQFRGRVGRGNDQSFCFLFTDSETEKSLERLHFFEGHNNGFELAEKDLEIRGPGEVYGTTQSGLMQLRLARLTDRELIKKARDTAHEFAPQLLDYPLLVQKMEEWEKTLHLE